MKINGVKRKIAMMLSIALLFSLAASIGGGKASIVVQAADHEGSLLLNGDYELASGGIPAGWNDWVSSGTPSFSISESVYKSGVRAFQLTSEFEGRGALVQHIPLQPSQRGKTYKLSQWIKTDAVTGEGAFNRLYLVNSKGARIGDIHSLRKLTGTQDWTLVEGMVFIPEDERIAGITIENLLERGTGTAWFDDASLLPWNEGANDVTNGGYEDKMTDGKPTGWRTWAPTGSPVIGMDSNVYHGGTSSLHVNMAETGRLFIVQNVPVTSANLGQELRIGAWLRTQDVSNQALLRIQFMTKDNTRIGNIVTIGSLSRTQDWTRLEQTVQVPDTVDMDNIRIEQVVETGTGQAWFDDVEVSPVSTALPDQWIRNGSFEEGMAAGKPADWRTWIPLGSPSLELDSSQYTEGLVSLKVTSQEQGRAGIIQIIPVTSSDHGKTFKAQSWLKADNVIGSGALTRLQFTDSASQRIGDLITLGAVNGTKDWTKTEKLVTFPDDPSIAFVRVEHFFEQGTGTAWFDDVRLLPWTPVQSIELDQDRLTMDIGGTVALSVYTAPADASDSSVIWSSSHPEIASVNNGTVTAHTEGVAVITAAAADGGLAADAAVIIGQTDTIGAEDDTVTVEENGAVHGQVVAYSSTGAQLGYQLLTQPGNGLANVSGSGAWSYYPNDDYSGGDAFMIAVNDGQGGFAIARIAITVNEGNAVPEASVGIFPTDKNTPVGGKVTASDADGDTLLYSIAAQPLHGQATMQANGNWSYVPDTDYTGADQFTVRVDDGRGGVVETLIRLYTAPTAADLISELTAANPAYQHPRLLAAESDFQRMVGLYGSDTRFSEWVDHAKERADFLLTAPVQDYAKPDGLRLNTEASRSIVTLAFVYRLTGDERYAERAWQELEHVSGTAYPDWSPGHFLDTATMSYGVGIGYDWLYSYLSEGQRAVIVQAIADKGLTPALQMYQSKSWWVYNRDNWNFVCNSGMAIAAMAAADELEQLAGQVLQEAFKSIQYGLTQYAPDGSAIEGPGYWEYGTVYLIQYVSALDTAFGHDFGFSDRDGLAETPLYPMHIAGPQGSFNYSDNTESLIPGKALLWFADHDNKPEYTWYHQFASERGMQPSLYDALWYRPELYGGVGPAELDRAFGIPHAVTMRSDWDDPGALFVGFKGGVNGAPHGDLDTGSFVLDAYGVRWALDLGKEDYNLPGYWNRDENGARWTYYRKRAEGHNTLHISPSPGADQKVDSISEITATAFNASGGAYAISDLTSAYDKAASIMRGVKLLDERRQFLVQDEIQMKVPSDVLWFMHTRAAIAISADGTSALLSQDGRQLWVKLLTPADASFSVMDAAPLATSPNPADQTGNYGVKKLTVKREGVLNETISIWMVPLMPGESPPDTMLQVQPLSAWQIESQELAALAGLTVNGQPLAEFKPNRYVYEVTVPADEQAAVVGAAAASGNDEVVIQQAGSVPGMARIAVTDPTGIAGSTVYFVEMKHPVVYGIPDNRPVWQPVLVTASEDDGNVPENTVDDDLESRWSAAGEQWIQYDLGENRDIEAVSIAYFNGHLRSGYFKVEVSGDGEVWQPVYAGESSGETLNHEVYAFPVSNARYVRITGYGNTQNHWNSITEVKIYGPQIQPKLSEVLLQCDCGAIKQKDSVPLHVTLLLDNGAMIDSERAELRYYSSDEKVANIIDGIIYTQERGEVQIWVEADYEGETVASALYPVNVIKKNGYDEDEDEDEDDRR
ncbi:Ig-like domain-containing protein [Paenibacillus sp. J5C_2022]|uniref:Ig-like domain-containing protein n=1 Tax=Paenibacillus sp. J5C2022 TaxID=2977129 RepID=UPI0021D29385|nr:Ig-like domain-containing protein [Paenibacillus sp. J5C2022]MCU6709749.1 Ig-like domain-containing protein [Paenibacillus sp. J5C2022]